MQRKGEVLPTLFDAILIDEGQDLVVEPEYKQYGVQPFYWLAYNLCRPVKQDVTFDLFDGAKPVEPLRRLIWGYDEAQSLDSPAIPTAKEVLGEQGANLLKGTYEGGIQRALVMKKCYRTPAPILTAAHAIGMGLLREGMISGMTNKEAWRLSVIM